MKSDLDLDPFFFSPTLLTFRAPWRGTTHSHLIFSFVRSFVRSFIRSFFSLYRHLLQSAQASIGLFFSPPPSSPSASAAVAAPPLFCPFFSFSSASSLGAVRTCSLPPAPCAAAAAADSFLTLMSLVTSCC